MRAKQYEITKREVFNAWKRVRANRGAAGVDGISLSEFERDLKSNLYKLWNRMSSGSYFPRAVRRVSIPKKDGSTRALGIPTVYDRVAQEVVRAKLEPLLESEFHEDSYGYRCGKSAIDAVRRCRERSWKEDWVLDVDIQNFFDTINHKLLLKAVVKHCTERWMVLYIERWLKTPIEHEDGSQEASERGTPQGNVSYRFLGYTFKPRKAQNRKTKKRLTSFTPAVSTQAQKHFFDKLRKKELRQWLNADIDRVARHINPLLRGWFGYFSHFHRSALGYAYERVNFRLYKWAMRKYRWGKRKALSWLRRLKAQRPNLFAHWQILKSRTV
ncbi:hypothetical protein BVY02_00820 [bacterium J17]|nr:hypothetical protein BVY02_00820 [bacterium J17]